jgi:hypothetical protein
VTHSELVQRGAKWLKSNPNYHYRSQIVLTEFKSYANEIPDVLGLSNHWTNLIECKVSLEDFKDDLKKPHRNYTSKIGNQRMYLCPDGFIPVELVPEGWGLLYCFPSMIKVIKEPPYHTEPEIRVQEYHILYSIALRAQIDGLLPQILRTSTERNREVN